MPYESPNIVIVPTMSLNNKKLHTKTTSDSDKESSTPVSVVLQPSPTIPTKVTQEASNLAKMHCEINKVSKDNVITNQGIISKSKVPQSDPASESTASSEDSKKVKKKPNTSWASNYLQSIGQNNIAKPLKVNLLSTSNDVIKQEVKSKAKNKCNQEIKINLLSRQNLAKPTDTKVRSPLLPTPNINYGVRPCMNTTRTCPSQLITTNQRFDCSSRVYTTQTRPPLLHTPTNLSIQHTPCMCTTCTCSPLLQNPRNVNLDFRPCMDTTWTHPPRFQTPTNLSIGARPHTTWTCTPQLTTPPNYTTGFGPFMDTRKYIHTNTINRPSENIDSNNQTTTLVRGKESSYTMMTTHDTPSSSLKSRMDYTWLTRAHYASINQPNKTPGKVKPVSQIQNTEKRDGKSLTKSLPNESIKPTLDSGRDNKLLNPKNNSTKCKENSNEGLLTSETNAEGRDFLKKSVGLKKEMRDKDKINVKKATKTLGTKIKKLTSDKKPFKIPKLSDSKKEYVELCKAKSETSTKNIFRTKKIIPKKTEKEKKQAPKKTYPSPKQTHKKRACHNVEKNEGSISKIRKLRHSNSSEPDRKSNRRTSETENSSRSKIKKVMHTNNEQKEGRYSIYKKKCRSETVETHGSERLQKKRKCRDSSYESMPKKRVPDGLEDIYNKEQISPIKSIVFPKKSDIKHPRIQAPDSDDSGEDFGSDLDRCDFDLRSKLTRVNYKRNKRDKKSYEAKVSNRTDMSRENLLITVNRNDDDETTVSPKPGPSIPKQKSKKYKKIRLVINVIQEDTSDGSSSDASEDTVVNHTIENNNKFANRKLDLSFLDDFNIDEIVNSLKNNPKLDNVQQNSKQKIENTKMATESVTNKFVQPIMIKNEMKTEQVDPEIQSHVKYSQECTPDNETNYQSLKSKHIQNSENILSEGNELINAVSIHNIKQEMHEHETENVTIDNSNTGMAYVQTSLDEDVLQTVNHLIDIVVENSQAFINTPSFVGIIRDIKREPCENDDNDFGQDNEPQDLFVANKEKNLENADTRSLTDLTDKQSNCSEPNNSCEFWASGKIFDETNQDTVKEIDKNVRKETSETIQIEVEEKAPKSEKIPATNTLVISDVIIEDNYEVNLSKEVIRTINLEQEASKTKIIQPGIKQKTLVNKLATNTSAISNVTIENNYKMNISREVIKTINLEQDTNATKVIQPEIEQNTFENNFITNTMTLSNVTIEGNYEVKMSSEVVINTNLEQDVNVTETIQTEVDETNIEDKLGTNTSSICDVTIENNKVKISSEAVKAKNLEQGVNVTETIQAEVDENILEGQLGTHTSAKSDVTIENNNEVKVCSEVVKTANLDNGTEAIKHQTEEKSSKDKPANNTLAKSDVITEIKNKKLTENKELRNNANTDTRTVTVMHPSLKSNKVLAIKIEERIRNYLNINLNVISLIHQGKFAKVFKCKDTNEQNYALKILKNERDRNRLGFQKEKMLNELQNDIPKENLNIVYFMNGFSLDQKWCFLMDYYPMNLGHALVKTLFDIDTVQELAKQLVSAVLLIRSNNIVHSDIKPAHILLNSTYRNLKVCGFDAAYYANEISNFRPNIGTVHYRAPEIILGFSAGFSIDVWATALVIYEMAAGRKLFDSRINYNSNVLFNQMSLCGQMPMDMIQNSRFSSVHFVGTVFKRVVGPQGQYVLYNMHTFREKTDIYNVLVTICNQKWSKSRSKWKQAKDRLKLAQMCRLLDNMLVLDPRQRLPIEFVYADSFFLHKSM